MMGGGVYKLSDASRYLRIHASTLRAWFKSRSDGQGRGPIFASDYPAVDGDFAISFVNLIEAHVARSFRTVSVRSSVLRRAHDVLRAEMNTPHPFAHADLLTDGRGIIRRSADAIGQVALVDTAERQRLFGELERGLAGVEYGPAGLAERWEIAAGVSIDPRLTMGRPVVRATGVATYILANQFHANDGDADLVADLFNVTPEQVRDAVSFEARSATSVAA